MISLHDVGLSQSLIDHLIADDRTATMWYRCQSAKSCQSSPITKRNMIGLWVCGTVLTYYDQSRKSFEQCSVEDIDDVWHSYKSLQGVLALLFIDAYEDEINLDQLRKYAYHFGFMHIDRMLCEISDEGVSYSEWRSVFPSTCV